MATREVEIDLGDAIHGTEVEIFDEAVNGKETDSGDDGEADRSLESMDDDVSDADEGEEGDGADGDDEGEGDKPEADAKPDRDDKGKFAAKDGKSEEDGEQQPERKGNPAVALREERQQRQALKTELDKEREERAAERDSFKSEFAKLEGRLDQVLRAQQQPVAPKAEEPKSAKPDVFTDPEGYDKWVEDRIKQGVSGVEAKFSERFIESSMLDAKEKHGEKFDTAFAAVKGLDRANPANVAILRNIREAPNPGAALMRWHRQQETLRMVGDDPDAFVNKRVEEAIAAKMKDPEFRKTMLADMQAEARGGSNGNSNSGKPRTIIRTPPSLNGASGRGESQLDPRLYDDSEKAVFESAFE